MQARSLASLPVELICDVTQYLNGEDVGMLWLCGNVVLNTKLSAGGVQKVEFKPHLVGTRLQKFPPFMASLERLRSFILLPFEYKKGFDSVEQWSSFPSNIRRLAFKGDFNVSAFTPLLQTTPHPLPHLKELELGVYKEGLQPVLDRLEELLPGLEKLELARMPNPGPPILTVLRLPRTLTHLRSAAFPLRLLSTEATQQREEWPPGLSSLILDELPWSFNLACLPQTLKYLELHSHIIYSPDQFDWSLLPSNLEHLALYNFKNVQDLLMKIPFTARAPIKSLNLGYSYQMQPVAVSEEFIESTLAFIQSLPPHLTILQHQFYYLNDERLCAALPRSLVDLRTYQFKPACLRFLPPGLTSLGLTLHGQEWPSDPDTPVIPEAVRSLTLKLAMPLKGAFPHMEHPVLKLLPRFLTRLRLDSAALSPEQVSLLPASLLYLITENHMPLRSEACFQALPKHLIELRADGYLKKFAPLPSPPTYLSPHLTSLHLERVVIQNPEEWFAHVPANLTSLYVRYKGTISARVVSALPCHRSLVQLYLHFSIMPQDAFVEILKVLPRRRLLGMSLSCKCKKTSPGCGMTNEDLQHLPPGLCSAGLPHAPLIDKGGLKFAPPCLTYFYAGDNSFHVV